MIVVVPHFLPFALWPIPGTSYFRMNCTIFWLFQVFILHKLTEKRTFIGVTSQLSISSICLFLYVSASRPIIPIHFVFRHFLLFSSATILHFHSFPLFYFFWRMASFRSSRYDNAVGGVSVSNCQPDCVDRPPYPEIPTVHTFDVVKKLVTNKALATVLVVCVTLHLWKSSEILVCFSGFPFFPTVPIYSRTGGIRTAMWTLRGKFVVMLGLS